MSLTITGYVTDEANASGFGSGKTLLMTVRLYRKFRQGRAVKTNYGVPFETSPLLPEDMANQSVELANIEMGADELQVWMDSRLNFGNVKLSHFVLQTRKRSVGFHYTSQDFIQVDKRVRRNTDFLVFCQKVGKHTFEYRVVRPRTGKLVRHFRLDGRPYYSLFNTRQIIKSYTGGKDHK